MRKNKLKTTWLLFAIAIPAAAVLSQTRGVPSTRRAEVSKTLGETARVFRAAEQTAADENRHQMEEQARGVNRAEQLVAQVNHGSTFRQVDGKEQAVLDASAKRLDLALAAVSSTEGKQILAQSASSPAMRAPAQEQVVPASEVKMVDVADAKPQPIRPTPLNEAKKGPEKTVITSHATFFSSRNALSVFTDDVVVHHPEFHITCDTLEVYMKKTDGKDAPPAGSTEGNSQTIGDSSIDRAIAKGRKVVIQKMSETGEMQIGTCRFAVYEGASGDLVMRDFPQVQRGQHVVIATDRSTFMTIKPSGELKTTGPNRVELLQQSEKNDAAKTSGAPVLKNQTPGGAQ